MEFKTYTDPQDFTGFNVPDVSLPPLDTFTYRSDFYVEENGKKKPRELTPEERIQIGVQQDTPQFDLSKPLYNYSHSDSKFFQNEDIVYNPYLDMEEIYAKVDPFTWGDSFAKAGKTFRNQVLSSWINLGIGLKGAAQGDFTKFYNNEHVEHVADLTEQLEQIKPQYKTQDQRDNPFAFRNWSSTIKGITPALGTVGAGIVDMVLGHVVATGVGAAAGGAGGGGVGAVPGAVGANLLQLSRDLNIFKTTVQGIYNLSKVLNTAKNVGLATTTMNGLKALATINNIKNASQLIGTSLIFSNSEAALQAELNARQIHANLMDDYLQQTGKYATGDDLRKIEEKAEQARNWTYGLNLALLSMSNAKQFGNLMRGKVTTQILDDLPVNFIVKDGVLKATQGSALKHIGKKVLGNMATEGLEEWSQSLIDDVVGGYYEDAYHNRANFLDQLGESMYKQITDQNAWLEFTGGALIGGITSVRHGFQYNKIKKQTEEYVDKFNSTTNQLFDSQVRSENFEQKLQEAVAEGNKTKIKDLIDLEMFNLANLGVKRGAAEAQLDLFKSMETMDNNEFNSHYQLSLTPEQQKMYAQTLQNEYRNASKVIQTIQSAFKTNPYLDKGFFRERARALEAKGLSKEDAVTLGYKVWEQFKDIYARALYSYEAKFQRLEDIKRNSPVDDYLITKNSKKAVNDWKKKTKQEIDAGIDRNKSLYESLDPQDIIGSYKKILNSYGLDYGAWNAINEGLQLDASLEELSEHINKAQTSKGQKQILNEIFDFNEHFTREEETEVQEKVGEDPITPRTPEENVVRETEVQEEDTSLENFETIAGKIQRQEGLTQEEERIYQNNREIIQGIVDNLETQTKTEELSLINKIDNLKNKEKLYPDKKYFEYKGKIGTHLQRVGRKLYLVNGKTKSEILTPDQLKETDKKTVPQAMQESLAEVKKVREDIVEETNLEKFLTQNPNMEESEITYLKDLIAKNKVKIIC